MKIFSVEELNAALKDFIVQQFAYPITVKGEISNVRMPQSGHQYFKLTDNDGFNKHSIDCVIWKGRVPKKAQDYDAKEVLITGNITMYKATAHCQIQISDITEYGDGALKKAIERIRLRLEKEGLFTDKKEFPVYPENIGVITSADSHALQDVLSKLKHRYPLAGVTIYPSLVQGNEAAKSIISQIRKCNQDKCVDVLMLIRGGGSLEDLMAFNDEDLAREIHKSNIPIVTGIGHQPDVTIADYVADAAMETPTAAAVFVTPDKSELIERLISYDDQIKNSTLIKMSKLRDNYLTTVKQINLYHPKNIVTNLKIQHKELHNSLKNNIELLHNQISSKIYLILNRLRLARKIINNVFLSNQNLVIDNTKRIKKMSKELHKDKYQQYKRLYNELTASNPATVLKKGYSIIRDSDGLILKSKSQVRDNQLLSAEFKDGRVQIKKASSKK
tara:strand:- start:2125 stop:3462 length:1338 start_codon:yes stop_codon:yes gene_type:complete